MTDEANTLTGVLKIEIDKANLAVTATFKSTSDGDEWTEERLAKALEERKLSESVPRDTLTAFLRKASVSPEPHSEVILRGVAPTQPAPEKPVWEDLPIPEAIRPVADAVTREADPPVVYRTVTETVERQKVVARKSGLPFRKEKQETKTVKETVQRKERVYIDATVQDVLYAPEGALLARITPTTTGMPGRDVYGRAIPVRKLADHLFHLGENVLRSGDEIRAGTDGLVRIGRNWVDIVPFAPHTWSVELSPDQATCYLSLSPGHRRCTPPTAEEILQAASDLPYPRESLMSPDEIGMLVAGQIEAGDQARLSISSSRDASFDIFVTEDRLAAFLNIHKGKGRGKPLVLREIGAAIKASGLKKLDFEKIKQDITRFYESTEMDLTSYPLCEGTAPVPGPDRQAEYAITFNSPAATQSIKTRLGEMKPEDLGEEPIATSFQEFPVETIQKTASVQNEQLLCTLDPPAPGEPGLDVYGVQIPADPGAAPPIKLFGEVKEQQSVIVTTSGGLLDYREDEDGTVFLRVRPHRDATVEVTVLNDHMEAFLKAQDGVGSGTRLSREMIDQALARARVTHGLDTDAIDRALQAARAGVPVTDLVVAQGTEPIHESENQIEFLVNIDDTKPVRIRKDGTADYRTQSRIITVEKDQEVCRILPSQQQAVDGIDVLGNTVSAKSITETPLEIGEHLRREEREDGSVSVLADADGEIRYRDKQLELITTYTIKGDVDMSVGNIRFPGSIIVGGTVRAGFFIVATGDVKIGGGVEGALISSDGDIIIKEGVKGAGKAVLRSKQSIMSPFVETATVLAVGDVVLKTALVRSRIKCNGTISFKGDKGRIIGGTIRARNGFEVDSVGSPRGVKTQLSFGQDYLIADLIEKEENEVEKVKSRITQVDLEMRKNEKAGDDQTLEKLRKEKVKLLKLMEKRGLRLFTLRERFEQHFPSKIIIKNDVHAGTVFESHGRTIEITQPRKAIAVEFDSQTGNINLSNLDGE